MLTDDECSKIRAEVLQAREPVSKLVRTAPKSIFLNISDEDDFDCDFNGGDMSEVSWSNNQVVRCAVEYVRADLVSQPLAPPAKQEAQEPIAWMNPVTGCAVTTCGYIGFDMPLYATPQPPAPEDFDAWIKNPYTIVLQKSIAEGYAPAPCPDCEQVIIKREAAYALADEYKAKVAELEKHRDEYIRNTDGLLLKAENEVVELEKDASRYRWLRSGEQSGSLIERLMHYADDDFDAAIDEAIAKDAQ